MAASRNEAVTGNDPAFGPEKALDGDAATYWATDDGVTSASVEVDLGAAQAFKGAGRKEPIIMMGNRQDELAWWKQEHDANGYDTWSASIAPGVSTLALWVAQPITAAAPKSNSTVRWKFSASPASCATP